MSEAILVLGMHRSGTSALAGALSRLGVPLGDRLVAGSEQDNPGGFYEHRDVVAAHDAAFLRMGCTWDDPFAPPVDLWPPWLRAELRRVVDDLVGRDFAGSRLWAVKDPRLCRTLSCWLDVLDERAVEPRCLLILRAPGEVADSLARRDGFSPDKSALLWLDHVLGALRASSGRARARVRFDELLEKPAATLSRCGRELGLAWPRDPADEADALAEFLRGDLRHHRGDGPAASPGPLESLATEVWDRLRDDPSWPENADLEAWHEALRERSEPPSSLLLEHATQVADRLSRDRCWDTETRLRGELAKQLEAMERRIGDTLHEVAEELAAHSRELRERGALLSSLEERSRETARLVAGPEGVPTGGWRRLLWRVLGRRD